ncbi:phosphatase PAP2 family protein [Prauserella cavernicola]|uniref:Phosphatase PAP2 family protein n=1 Tax=Prauserella cavernicola TaxID=2800127 RepID=A0A934QPB6_9PSEU|nr:phosphatase PAP2 family protein [Prauserella cavernicola]MBK1783677.1 phosphatase PAP2 family protein [Prauserella cavernicola]
MVADVRAPERAGRDNRIALLLAAAACLLGLLLTGAVFLGTPGGQDLDQSLLHGPGRDAELVESATALLAVAGDPLVLAAVLAGVLLAGALGGRIRGAVAGVVLFACSIAGARVLKNLVQRPDLGIAGSSTHNSFPSGHVAAATAVVLAVLLVLPPRARWWAAVPGLVAVAAVGGATMIASWHRLSDVLGAVLLAGALGCLAFWSTGGARSRL